MKIQDFKSYKLENKKISMITCYDYCFAGILEKANIDCILVGDSAAMVMHGYTTTIQANIEMLSAHTQSVAKGAPSKFIIADLPFLSFRKSLDHNMTAVEQLMKSGAQAVKLEGAAGNLNLIRHITESGVPVMGHLGLTPQSIHQLGGFKVQGKSESESLEICRHAEELQTAGCFALVLECVPNQLASTIAKKLSIPVIGIGAGLNIDGQVLVLQDMLGMQENFHPKFLRKYLDGFNLVLNAVNEFDEDVKSLSFPNEKESYL